MGAIKAADVAKLRKQTGAGMMDCKTALVEANGDFDAATLTVNGALTANSVSAAGLNLGGTAVTATAAELNYVDGVTSSVQTQLDAKATNINGLSDALIEDNSMYIGDPPNTDDANYNYSIGLFSLGGHGATVTGDNNLAIGHNNLAYLSINYQK